MSDEDLSELEADLRAMEAADPKLAVLRQRVDDAAHFMFTGEEVGTFARARNRERRLSVMKARRRLWPSRNAPERRSEPRTSDPVTRPEDRPVGQERKQP